jgi:hypothetical protein
MERLSWHRTCERLGGDVILKIVAADALKRTPYLITRSCSAFFCHQIVSLPASTPAIGHSAIQLHRNSGYRHWCFPIC